MLRMENIISVTCTINDATVDSCCLLSDTVTACADEINSRYKARLQVIQDAYVKYAGV